MTDRPQEGAEAQDDRAGVTIHDVARVAKVSIATVSRVLNASTPVKGATSTRVQAAIDSLGYVPHSGARSLSRKETRTIGALLPDMFGEFFSEIIRGLDQVARNRHYSLLVTCTHGDSDSAEAMLRTMHGKVDGVVILSSDLTLHAGMARLLHRTPAVFLNQVTGDMASQCDSISVDNHGGALSMVRYFIGLGHERIGFIRGPENNMDALQRLQGYREAMAALPGPRDPDLEAPGDFGEASGYRAACRLLRCNPRPTAIFAANDDMAIGALAALKDQGVRVPEDLSLAGFDDVPIVRYLTPALTSIRAPISEMGAMAAERLLTVIESGGAIQPRQQTLDVLLVPRGSTRPPTSRFTATPTSAGPASSTPPK